MDMTTCECCGGQVKISVNSSLAFFPKAESLQRRGWFMFKTVKLCDDCNLLVRQAGGVREEEVARIYMYGTERYKQGVPRNG